MATTTGEALISHYQALQKPWKVTQQEASYGKLVIPTGNSQLPFHRWFHLKEAYSSQLLAQLFTDSGYSGEGRFSVFDPFSGSGTTALSAVDLATTASSSVTVAGIERNPFIWELSQAKLQGRVRGRDYVNDFEAAFDEVDRHFRLPGGVKCEIPRQSTLQNDKYFPKKNVEDLVAIRTSIDAVSDGPIRSMLRVALASSVEACGRLRRDGRALRYEPSRRPRPAWEVFAERSALILQDLSITEPTSSVANIALGDGRGEYPAIKGTSDCDWIVFSPPYPNNIDYTEVYKTEAWILGCYKSAEDMRAQRLLTVRSHPSVRFNRQYSFEGSAHASAVEEIIRPILRAVPDDRYKAGRLELIKGYADDMLTTLQSCRRAVAHHGKLAFVVGNSAHGAGEASFVIAADILMGALAELVGWRVADVRVARHLKRRTGDLLRESVVLLEPI
ncbi:hypothetical protein SUDANB15_05038 [Streptomyces sp. enrichment culture]|uniref:hypothetical protein n=1 Tax=Streptomyces sp. enrichment culture TaxID=1795815 RepID=UPI003F5631DA